MSHLCYIHALVFFLAGSESLKPQAAAAEKPILHVASSVLFPSKNCDKTSFDLIGIGRPGQQGGRIDQSLEMSWKKSRGSFFREDKPQNKMARFEDGRQVRQRIGRISASLQGKKIKNFLVCLQKLFLEAGRRTETILVTFHSSFSWVYFFCFQDLVPVRHGCGGEPGRHGSPQGGGHQEEGERGGRGRGAGNGKGVVVLVGAFVFVFHFDNYLRLSTL